MTWSWHQRKKQRRPKDHNKKSRRQCDVTVNSDMMHSGSSNPVRSFNDGMEHPSSVTNKMYKKLDKRSKEKTRKCKYKCVLCMENTLSLIQTLGMEGSEHLSSTCWNKKKRILPWRHCSSEEKNPYGQGRQTWRQKLRQWLVRQRWIWTFFSSRCLQDFNGNCVL